MVGAVTSVSLMRFGGFTLVQATDLHNDQDQET